MWAFSPEAVTERFEKNMRFFRSQMHSLYKVIEATQLTNTTLSIDTEKQEFDIFYKSQSLYLGKGFEFVQSESDKFLAQFSKNAPVRTLVPVSTNGYTGPRFFHRSINAAIQRFNQKSLSPIDHFIPEKMPMVVFGNIGSGLHIQKVLEQKDIQIVVIQEQDPEILKASCYFTDWFDIIPKFKASNKRHFNFNIIRSDQDDQVFRETWNELIRYSPIFPALTVFYNHRNSAFYDRVIKQIHDEFKVFITAWGFYDDEVNQLNNAKHNLKAHYPVIPKTITMKVGGYALASQAVIVGAGPSVNERIEWIKENREHMVLFSAGTALSILKHNGITPDVHVEIESDYATALHLSHTLDDDFKVPLMVGAIQLNPLAFNLIENNVMFFKDSTAMFEIFGKEDSVQMQGMTPTCTNAATGLAIQLGFTDVFLIGCDFGYKKASESHAKGSVYFDKEAPDYLQSVGTDRSAAKTELLVESVDGEMIQTESLYNAARDRLEKLLMLHEHRINIYNCSQGAKIKHTQYLDTIEKIQENFRIGMTTEGYSQALLDECKPITDEVIHQGISKAYNYLKTECDDIIGVLKNMNTTRDDLIYALLKIGFKREDNYRAERNSLYFMIRGTFWHYMNAAITGAFATTNTSIAESHIESWKRDFIQFLEKMPQHFEWISTSDTKLSEDEWLTKRIKEYVPDPFVEEIN